MKAKCETRRKPIQFPNIFICFPLRRLNSGRHDFMPTQSGFAPCERPTRITGWDQRRPSCGKNLLLNRHAFPTNGWDRETAPPRTVLRQPQLLNAEAVSCYPAITATPKSGNRIPSESRGEFNALEH
jgi:hypothetical protein